MGRIIGFRWPPSFGACRFFQQIVNEHMKRAVRLTPEMAKQLIAEGREEAGSRGETKASREQDQGIL